jgi:ligand-binding sensor domain-containing protein/two-component sensor histidine kinase
MPDSIFFRRSPLLRAIIVLLFVTAFARAEQLSVKTYTSADGLIYEGIYRLYQDSRGFIWFATPIGVSRFDGYRFTNYGMEDGLFNTLINDFIEDDNGVYWLGSSSGGNYGAAIYRFDPRVKNRGEKKFIPFNIGEEAAANNVNRLFKNGRGQIFAATDGGLFTLDDAQTDKKFSRVSLNLPASEDQTFPVYSLAEDAEGNLWVGHERGLTRLLPDGRSATYEIRTSDAAASSVFSLGFDNQNRLWIVTGKRTVTVFKPEPAGSLDFSNNAKRELRLETAFNSGDLRAGFAYAFKPAETQADGAFGAVYCARDGKVFFGSRGKGLIEFDGENFRFYTRENGLSDNNVSFVREDSFGNLWLASSWGAMKITLKVFITYNIADGLFADRISDLFTDRAGTIYAVNAGWYINQFDGRRFVSVRPNLPADPGGFWIHHIIRDSREEWWIPTPKGLFRFPRVKRVEQLATAQPIAVYTSREGLAADNVLMTFEDSRGDIWFSYDSPAGRISRWERSTGTFHHYTPQDGIPETCRPFYYNEDAAGALLITCQFESYLVYRDGRFTAHTTPEMKKGAWLHRALVDRKGRFWIGTPLNGLLRYDNPTSENPTETVYLKKDGLSSSHIQYLVEDLYGKIYYVTSSGMDRIDPETGEIKYYNVADGFPAAGTGVAMRGRDGELWLGTSRGLSKFVPEPDKQSSSPPVFISSLRIAGNEMPVSVLGETEISDLTLAPDERQMQIDFYGLSLASGETLRYQYKLEGVSGEWSPATDQRTVNYPNLSSGSYRFLVRAVNPDGSFSSQPATISFTVLRPVWQRWWFLLLAALVAGAGVYALYRYRIAQVIKLERVRTRIATDLHDDIGSSLSQIAILSEVVRQKVGDNGAGEPLNMIAETSREMVDAMSDIVWAINPQKDHLNNLVQRMRRFAEDILDAQEISYRFNALENLKDVPVGSDVRREVYMIFKECVNNVVKHSGAARVDFRINSENEFLLIEISDDGRGFDTAQAENLDSLGGNGLINMRRRAENLGGTFSIDSAPGKGTRAVIKIPIVKKFFSV